MFINQVIAQVNNKKKRAGSYKRLSARPHIKNAVRVPCNKQNKGSSRHEPTRHQSRAPTTRRHITAMPPNPRGKRRTAHSPILLTEGGGDKIPLKKGRLEDKKTHWQVFWLADIRPRDAFSPPPPRDGGKGQWHNARDSGRARTRIRHRGRRRPIGTQLRDSPGFSPGSLLSKAATPKRVANGQTDRRFAMHQ